MRRGRYIGWFGSDVPAASFVSPTIKEAAMTNRRKRRIKFRVFWSDLKLAFLAGIVFTLVVEYLLWVVSR